MKRIIRSYSIEPSQAESAAAKRLAGKAPGHAQEAPAALHYRDGKQHVALTAKRGEAFHLCASAHRDYLCCQVQVLAAVSNCPYDCSYCFLQNYLTDNTTQVIADTGALIEEVRQKAARQPWRFFRVGTWELGDSLALEDLTGTSAELVERFAELPYALLELKTKSAEVEGLLDLDHRGRTVVSWSLNPEAVVRREELRTASLAERLDAMRRVVEAGYPVAAHFDPMIHYDGWESGYRELARQLFEAVPAERVAWISLGSLRFNPEMKKVMEDNFPGSRITTAEMVLGDDGKMRYIKPLRMRMYRHLHDALREHGGDGPFTYLCMERWDVWERLFGERPASSGEVDYLFTRSLYQRFPGLVPEAPERERYVSELA
ncbi:MAG: hypothetical protein Kow006_27520 [Gammaproteobacteria bacterium]